MGNISESIAHHLEYMTGAIQIGGFTIPRGVYTSMGHYAGAGLAVHLVYQENGSGAKAETAGGY